MRCPSQHFLAGQVLYPASIIAGDGEGLFQLLLRELSGQQLCSLGLFLTVQA